VAAQLGASRPFSDYPEEIRRVIYATDAVESVNMSLRKISKHRGSFPTAESALNLLYLALRNITRHWTMPIKDWRAALNPSRSSLDISF
jgi:putative transposase